MHNKRGKSFLRGLPFMTSALRGGGALAQGRCSKGGCVDLVLGQGGMGLASPKFCGRHKRKPPQQTCL